MILHILRALFVLLMAAVGFFFLEQRSGGNWGTLDVYAWLAPGLALTVGVLLVCVDILAPRSKLTIFSGTFFGLTVGLILAYVLSFVVELLSAQYLQDMPPMARTQFVQFINIMLSITCSYFAISFILQTKDDFRFIIPYVEFSKQTRGARPILIDTSVLIDGRVVDIVNTGIIESQLIVPRFVLGELQTIADNADKLKRNRGRRGLDVLAKLQANKRAEVILYDPSERDSESSDVDQRLMNLAQELNGRVLTNDFNLNKVAQLRSVDVINLNDLANAMKPVVLPGERMVVRLQKPGEEPGQGVGYLEDGTMVVVEGGREQVNNEVEISVTSVIQTSAGKMIFGRFGDAAPLPPRRGRSSAGSR